MPKKSLSVIRFEHHGQPVASRRKFLARMFIAIGIWIVLTLVGLAIGIAGYAENLPVDTNDTPVGRAHNRRVDLVILNQQLVVQTEPEAHGAVAAAPHGK